MMAMQACNRLRATLNLPYKETLKEVEAALREQGLTFFVQIDMRTMLDDFLGMDIGEYTVLGACNPMLAYLTLQAEREIGLMFLCSIIVYEDVATGTTRVSILEPNAMVHVTGNPLLKDIADDVHLRLEQVVASL